MLGFELINKNKSVFSINVLAFCHECRSLISYNTSYLFKQYSVSVEELSADSCLAEICCFKTNICPRGKAARSNMLVLRTLNFQRTIVIAIVLRQKHSIFFIVHH